MGPTNPFTSKLKVHLKLAISRLRIVQQKDQAIAKQQRRDMASLLEQGKIESARIRVENIIRADLITELHEILELYCELLLARIGILDQTPNDGDLAEPICSIIYAAPRTEIKELQQTRQLLVEKFGREYAARAMEKEGVPERVLRKLRVEPPAQELVESYLREIARAYDVRYGDEPASDDDGGEGGGNANGELLEAEDQSDDPGERGDDNRGGGAGGGGGGQKETALEPALLASSSSPSSRKIEDELSRATPPRKTQDLGIRSPVSIAPPSPSTEKPNPHIKVPYGGKAQPKASAVDKAAASKTNGVAAGAGPKKPEGTVPDVDDLEARFKLLKR